jgi:hypothetical protein
MDGLFASVPSFATWSVLVSVPVGKLAVFGVDNLIIR